ncbi:hypothetical protein PYCH_10650 [Pyrococcus yayanosii CH1]|uniref:Class III signal peptide-containing protein n=2 Tax=Pyrococcus TaxID=2260 RepID=F8AER4_PYRYC|nr:hypothetical protein PYCH_10650 [Pyrococcus yayanosii CH1]
MVRRGQMSLEFMVIFSLLLIMLFYSVNNLAFTQGTIAQTQLTVEVALEAKQVATTIAGTISQVYAQGPGSKATSYVSLRYLSNTYYLERAFSSSQVQIAYINGSVRVTIGDTPITNGPDKNTFSAPTLYNTTFDTAISFSDGVPVKTLKVVVEWNPDKGESWTFDDAKGVLMININPGG